MADEQQRARDAAERLMKDIWPLSLDPMRESRERQAVEHFAPPPRKERRGMASDKSVEAPPVRNSLCPDCPFRRSSGQRDSMIRTVVVANSPGEWWPCHMDDPDGWGLMGCAGRQAADGRRKAKAHD